MSAKRLIALLAVPALAAGTALACPGAAWAQAANTGTTDVTVQAGPGWGQKVETVEVKVKRQTPGDLARTGDPAFWAPLALAGAATASGGLLMLKRNRSDEDGDDAKGEADGE